MKWTGGGSRQNLEDRRGMRMGAVGGLGAGGVVIALILSLVFGVDVTGMLGGGGGGQPSQVTEGPVQTTPAEDSLVEFMVFVLNDAQAMWARQLPAEGGTDYRDARLVLFRDAVQSACGMAGSATGPFYCPGDERVYIDLGFYHELDRRFGAEGDFAQAYVLAHEIGHHVQHVRGVSDQVHRLQQQQPDAANELSVRLELQADCYAGVWANTTRDRRLLDPGDIEEGLGAASAVGDDRIQQMSGRAVNPESWTHGSARERSQWFRRGFDSGRMEACETFNQ